MMIQPITLSRSLLDYDPSKSIVLHQPSSPGPIAHFGPKLIHICGEDGQELPIGKEGEVYFESGHQFEYHNDPDKTAHVTNQEGWTTLGDVGRVGLVFARGLILYHRCNGGACHLSASARISTAHAHVTL